MKYIIEEEKSKRKIMKLIAIDEAQYMRLRDLGKTGMSSSNNITSIDLTSYGLRQQG